jgi:hypothetical protein
MFSHSDSVAFFVFSLFFFVTFILGRSCIRCIVWRSLFHVFFALLQILVRKLLSPLIVPPILIELLLSQGVGTASANCRPTPKS